MRQFLNELSPGKRLSLLGLIALIILSLVWAAIWLFLPRYEALAGQMDPLRASQAAKFLEESQIPFEVQENNNGVSILVQEGEAERLRLSLSENLNLPDIVGLEIFDNADYSMTDFSQQVAFQRALQGELSRTLAAIPGVEMARVHLSLAPKRLFKAQQTESTASVFLTLMGQFPVENIDAFGIQQLIANAVTEMAPEAVKVFDQDGRELSVSDTDQGLRTVDSRNQIIQEKEQQLVLRASHLLSLYFPAENIAIAVSVSMNFDQKTQRKEELLTLPGGDGFMRKVNESKTIATLNTDDEEPSQVPTNLEKDVEYIHGKALEETVFSAGDVHQISIGVGIKAKLTEDVTEQLENLLVAGLGLDSLRGDNIHLFSTPEIVKHIDSQVPEAVILPPPVTIQTANQADDKPLVEPQSEVVSRLQIEESTLWGTLMFSLFIVLLFVYFNMRSAKPDSVQEIHRWLEEEKPL